MKNANNLQYIVEHAAELFAAGVTVLEAGEGQARVRVEFTPLRVKRNPAIVAESAEPAPSDAEPERAGDTPARPGEDADKPSAFDLDLAHLDDTD